MSHSPKGTPLAQMASDEFDPEAMRAILRTIEQRLIALEKPDGLGYTVTNHAERRTMDEDTITLPQLAEVVGTLLKDLHTRKRITGSVT